MKTLRLALALLVAPLSHAQSWIYSQPPAQPNATPRESQLRMTSPGQNPSIFDALAWEDFTLPQDALVTHLRWWGSAPFPNGFVVSLLHEDPSSPTPQPDIFAAQAAPILSEPSYDYTLTATLSGFRFEHELSRPVHLVGGQRYFFAVHATTPMATDVWTWSQATSGSLGTFWWERSTGVYSIVADERALALGTTFGTLVGSAACDGDGSNGPCPCGNEARGPGLGCRHFAHGGATLAASGSASVAADDLVLTALALPGHQNGLLFVSPNLIAAVPLGDGLRCLAGPVSRFPVRNSGQLGTFTEGPGLASWSLANFGAPNHFLPGRTLAFQAWFRDGFGPCGHSSNLSSARVVTFLP
jgi:hypothetical protein